EQLPNLAQAEAGALRGPYHRKGAQGFRGVTAPAGNPGRFGEETDRFVVADRRGTEPCPAGHLTDEQFAFRHLTSSRLEDAAYRKARERRNRCHSSPPAPTPFTGPSPR